jgi:hypothetical protein
LLDTVPLGTYTVNIFWGDGQSDSLTAGLQLSDCETPPPPTPTTRPPTPTTRPTTPNNPTSPAPTIRPQPTIVTPVPTVEQPAVESDVLIPVTGLETSALLLLLGPFRQAILFTGLAFIGMAFIFQGMRKRFGG